MAAEERRGVPVPPELHAAPPRVLEDYARARILQFASAFAARLNPTVAPGVVQQAARDCLGGLPAPDYSGVPVEQRDLQLVFRHDCLSLGCLDAQCVLCEHNPHRRCSVNFSPKCRYLVNDAMRAKCDAPIRVELIDRATGQPLGADLPDVSLELCVLDGNAYDAKVAEAGEETEEDLEACALLLNNKAQPLLGTGPGGTHTAESKVSLPLRKGVAVLPDLCVSDSSEAMLSGRKPPFRLMVRAVHARGAPLHVRHAVSEGFVVATRRTRTAGKVEIPNVDDHISKLEHMGKETVKKLGDVAGSAAAAGLDIHVPDNAINKVGEFRKLALLAEADGHLRQKLQQLLKLSKEKWEEARDHAMRAVVADNRMRIWYADQASMEVGLLFTCRLGDVDLDRPVGLLTKKAQEGAQTTMEATLMAQQTPAQRDQVRALQPQAVAAWWQQGHPGWAIYPVDSEQFLETGTLDSAAPLPMPPAEPPAPPPAGFVQPQSPSAGGGAAPLSAPTPPLPAALPPLPPAAAAALNPALASFMGAAGGGLSSDALLRAMSPLIHGGAAAPGALQPFAGLGGVPGLTAAAAGLVGAPQGARESSPRSAPSAFAAAAQQPSNPLSPAAAGAGSATPFANTNMPPPPPASRPAEGSGGAAPAAAGVAGAGLATTPSAALSLANLTSLFGGDLARLPQLAGLGLANFPSLPPGMMSGDLETLLQAQGSLPEGLFGVPGRAPSFNIGKLESLNLPDDALAALLQAERAGAVAGLGASLPGARLAAAGQQQAQQQQAQQQQAQQRVQEQAAPPPAGPPEQQQQQAQQQQAPEQPVSPSASPREAGKSGGGGEGGAASPGAALQANGADSGGKATRAAPAKDRVTPAKRKH